MDAPPDMQLPPVKSAQHALKTEATGGALQRKVSGEAAPPPPGAPIVTQAASAGGADSILAEHASLASPARAPASPKHPVIPEGKMTLADLASYAGVHMPTGDPEPVDEEAVDEGAGWSAGDFLKSRTPQQRKTGPGLAAAAISKMYLKK